MQLGKLARSLFGRVDTRCQHLRGVQQKWLDREKTPMMSFSCPDCGYTDTGHVHADPQTWLNRNEPPEGKG